MRCLYCGKELALLKRLTGGGDFCSDAHKQSYQEEYNRLALSRLLQAQNKGQQANKSAAQSTAPPPGASVAVEEPVTREAVNGTQAPPVRSVSLREPEPEPVVEPVIEPAEAEEPAPEVEAEVEEPVSAEPEPQTT